MRRLLDKTARPIQVAMLDSELQLGAVGEGVDLHSEDEAGGGAAHMDQVSFDRARPALAAAQYA